VLIEDIRPKSEEPGLMDYEVNFLRLVDTLTNGTQLIINETGTKFRMRPGLGLGGRRLKHTCVPSRGVGYLIEAVIPLLLFSKTMLPSEITFDNCVTNHDLDPSVDAFNNSIFPFLQRFGAKLELKVINRGLAPKGGGKVLLKVAPVKRLDVVELLDPGQIKRIRGHCYTVKMAPTTANRVGVAARGILNEFIPDVWIYTDHYKGKEAGESPGYGLSLCAESTTECKMLVELCAPKGVTPESFGETVAKALCQEVAFCGCVESSTQSLAMLLMVLCPEDLSKVRFGPLAPHAIDSLRTIYDFFGIRFKLVEEKETGTVTASCIGIGYENISRTVS